MKVRTEARREAILDIASHVFREFGFERASMAEIVRRIGGSKSTIYGYYPSKEALFQAVTQAAGERHVRAAFEELAAHDISTGIYDMLHKFAQSLAAFIARDEIVATQRMVLGEAGHSDMGELFYEAGPKCGITDLAVFFERVMALGGMRAESPTVASQHFAALVQAEILPRWYYRNPPPLTTNDIQAIAHRAVVTFARAYDVPRGPLAVPGTAPSGPSNAPEASETAP